MSHRTGLRLRHLEQQTDHHQNRDILPPSQRFTSQAPTISGINDNSPSFSRSKPLQFPLNQTQRSKSPSGRRKIFPSTKSKALNEQISFDNINNRTVTHNEQLIRQNEQLIQSLKQKSLQLEKQEEIIKRLRKEVSILKIENKRHEDQNFRLSSQILGLQNPKYARGSGEMYVGNPGRDPGSSNKRFAAQDTRNGSNMQHTNKSSQQFFNQNNNRGNNIEQNRNHNQTVRSTKLQEHSKQDRQAGQKKQIVSPLMALKDSENNFKSHAESDRINNHEQRELYYRNEAVSIHRNQPKTESYSPENSQVRYFKMQDSRPERVPTMSKQSSRVSYENSRPQDRKDMTIKKIEGIEPISKKYSPSYKNELSFLKEDYSPFLDEGSRRSEYPQPFFNQGPPECGREGQLDHYSNKQSSGGHARNLSIEDSKQFKFEDYDVSSYDGSLFSHKNSFF